MEHEEIIANIREAEAMGLIPEIKKSLTDDDINTIISEVYLRETESVDQLQKSNFLISLLDGLDEKGVMDEIFPDGYKLKRKKLFKKV